MQELELRLKGSLYSNTLMAAHCFANISQTNTSSVLTIEFTLGYNFTICLVSTTNTCYIPTPEKEDHEPILLSLPLTHGVFNRFNHKTKSVIIVGGYIPAFMKSLLFRIQIRKCGCCLYVSSVGIDPMTLELLAP